MSPCSNNFRTNAGARRVDARFLHVKQRTQRPAGPAQHGDPLTEPQRLVDLGVQHDVCRMGAARGR